MEQLSFFEKLGVLFQNILAHPFFIFLLLLPVLFIVFNKKVTKKAVVIVYVVVLLIVLFVGNTTLFALFDNLMDNIFMTLYFPNFITLFLVELMSAIICLITFLKHNISKVSKVTNIIGFSIVQTLFILILVIIQSNNIDIYKENALYASNDVLTLMQLLMGTFFLQILILVVFKAIDKVTEKLDGVNESEIIEKHTIKLPEGRITHAKLGEKVIIREPKVIKEQEVIYKEPEVKLDIQKPVKPLDKTLIENVNIKPIDVNEAILKEKSKPKPTIKAKSAEVLTDVRPKQKIEPLDKTLIESIEITPIDINKEISKEENKSKPTIKAKETEILTDIKPKEEIQVFEDIKDSSDKASKPEIKETPIKSEFKFETPIVTVEEKPKEENKDKEMVKENFENIKNKFKQFINNTKETISNKIKEFSAEEQKEEPRVPENRSKPQFVNPNQPKKPDLLKPMEEPVKVEPEAIQQEKELITNLQIIDYEKTVKALKNLSTVYTL